VDTAVWNSDELALIFYIIYIKLFHIVLYLRFIVKYISILALSCSYASFFPELLALSCRLGLA
jgi:hypothetical protein